MVEVLRKDDAQKPAVSNVEETNERIYDLSDIEDMLGGPCICLCLLEGTEAKSLKEFKVLKCLMSRTRF